MYKNNSSLLNPCISADNPLAIPSRIKSSILYTLAILVTAFIFTGCETEEIEEVEEPSDRECLSVPVCTENEQEVESCEEGDESCNEITLCGSSIFCKAVEHSSCTEEPMCPPNSNRIESCSEALENCIELSVCEQTIYCDQHEPFCDAPYYCDNNEREVESCEGIEDRCYTHDGCSGTVHCEQLSCDELMVCPNPNMIMVDTCEGSETDCVVVSNSECESIFCQEPEVACMASPTCQEDEVESFGSENACVDDGSTCTEVSECGVTIYCRPAREVALLYCEEPITNPIGLDSARIEDDQLFFGLMLSGGCGLAPIFPGCFSDFQESSPVQVTVTLGLEGGEDPCDGIYDAESSLDLSFLKQAYRDAYQTNNGEIILNIEGYDTPLEYSF